MRYALLLVLALWLLPAWSADPITGTLPNGLRYAILPTTASQVLTIELLVDYSALDESAPGLRQVLVTGMLQGSAEAGGNVIRRSITAAGGRLGGLVLQDALEFTATAPSGALREGLTDLAEIVCRPQLADENIDWAVTRTREQQEEEPVGAVETAARQSHELLFAGHPYYSRCLGTPASLAVITPDRVRAAYQGYLSPSNTVVTIVGRCDPEVARAELAIAFGGWQGKRRLPHGAFAVPALPVSRLVLREAPVRNTCVMLTFPVCGVTHPDFITLRVIDALLGGGTGARLFRAIRERQQIAYEVSSIFPSLLDGSSFSVYALVNAEHMEETKKALVSELARLQVDPITETELTRAKAYLKGRYLLSHQYSAQYAFDLAWYEMIGLGAGYDATLQQAIDAVTAADIQRVARAYFTRYYLVVIVPRTVAP